MKCPVLPVKLQKDLKKKFRIFEKKNFKKQLSLCYPTVCYFIHNSLWRLTETLIFFLELNFSFTKIYHEKKHNSCIQASKEIDITPIFKVPFSPPPSFPPSRTPSGVSGVCQRRLQGDMRQLQKTCNNLDFKEQIKAIKGF